MMIRIREAAVAGSFYPVDAGELRSTVQRLLDAVPVTSGPAPKAVVVPHAGYIYSGPTAAAAYARIRAHRDRYSTVVLIGPCHCVPFGGLAVSGAEAFRTPLGDVALDLGRISTLVHPALAMLDAVHRYEHSLEVQLPFLQSVLPSFRLVPLVVGDAKAEDVADVIDCLWGGPETLIVISTDLSHYLAYEEARDLDRRTCRAVESLATTGIREEHACGAIPLRGLLCAARRHALHPVTLDLRNSGDTAGDREHVVGYGAWMFVEEESCQRAA